MSVYVSGWVYKHFPGSGSVFQVALALADHAHDDGTRIYPSVDALAEKTRLDRRTVQRAIRALEAMGWLERVATASGRPGLANVYQINRGWLETGLMPELMAATLPTEGAEEPLAVRDEAVARGDSMPPLDGVLSTNQGAALSARGAVLSPRGAATDRPNHQGTIKEPSNTVVGGYRAHNSAVDKPLAVSEWQPSAAALMAAARADGELELAPLLDEFRLFWLTRRMALPPALWDLKFLQRVQLLAAQRAANFGGPEADYLLPKAIQFKRRDASETGESS